MYAAQGQVILFFLTRNDEKAQERSFTSVILIGFHHHIGKFCVICGNGKYMFYT